MGRRSRNRPRNSARSAAPTSVPNLHMGEIATTGDARDITESFLGRLRPLRDAILLAKGSGLELYEEVKRDDRVFTALQQRRLGLVSKPWDVEPGADDQLSLRAAAALKADLKRVGWDRVCEKMHWGVFWGRAVAECIWAERTDEHGRRWTFDAIKVRKVRRFASGTDGSLRLLTMTNQFDGEVMPERKFWEFSAGEDADDYPYGLGLAHWLYWPVYFKRHSLRMWAQAVEKFAGPTTIGRFPPNASTADQNRLLAALRAVHQEAGIIVPEGTEIDLLETVKSAGADQALLYAAMDRAIATIITGQSTTIEAASNRAQTETHKDVRDELIQADNDLLHGSFQEGPLSWWTEWNFPGAVPPTLTRALEPEEDQEASTRVDEALDRMGWALTEEQVRQRYGNGYVRKSMSVALPPSGLLEGKAGATPKPGSSDAASFSEVEPAPRDAIADAAEEAAGEWEMAVGPLADAARALAARSLSLEELLSALPAALEAVPLDALVEAVAAATLQARVAGRVGAPLSEAEANASEA